MATPVTDPTELRLSRDRTELMLLRLSMLLLSNVDPVEDLSPSLHGWLTTELVEPRDPTAVDAVENLLGGIGNCADVNGREASGGGI
ncbi:MULTISPECIES: hypothetical protein [unclassified Neorhizobium]|uniref:hypothetical protein n=1 Tax=unclassified Neorhizobium TaxID=2629175 RepID=UPI001FF5A323|nr:MULTISPECIES: hypothetical protein [unclassified Neorhizobium]MCJ9670403.1 hypothetical protein [Neorhizobium sp. SHOUNA12B]MCJ9746285.1 hypothetical protein [Neorhizobium sp. SHOUNA12A]